MFDHIRSGEEAKFAAVSNNRNKYNTYFAKLRNIYDIQAH